MRSSIRSRSTSQNLSDDRRSLSISSAWADSLSSIVSGCGVPERLLNFRGLRLNFNVRHLARFGLVAPINHSPLVSSFLLKMCSHHSARTVVPNHSAARARIFIGIKLPNSSGGSKNRHDGHAKLGGSPRYFRSDLGRREGRRAAASARTTLAVPTVSLGGRRPAKYCASNARRAAATVGPIPTIPSSMLGPSNAIQSSLRKSNRGRRTADGLPG